MIQTTSSKKKGTKNLEKGLKLGCFYEIGGSDSNSKDRPLIIKTQLFFFLKRKKIIIRALLCYMIIVGQKLQVFYKKKKSYCVFKGEESIEDI